MPLNVEEFIHELAVSGLMSDADVQVLRQTAPADNLEACEFAKRLVSGRRLTGYQARALLHGEGRTLVLGNYTILDRIGAGGMGVVLKAQHRRMKRRVALKTLRKSAMECDSSIQRFHQEVEAAARLSHPHIVTAFDADEAKGVHFYAMEYVDGRDLLSLVKQKGPLPVDAALDCILQAARGLEYAHAEGVIHRDIKPTNLLLDHKGVVKILDMGLARIDSTDLEDHTQLTGTGQIMGTIDYMAPEQALDTKHADARADVYSLGATLNYLLTARPMLPGDTHGKKMQTLLSASHEQTASLQAHRDDVADELERAFQKMVARDPDQRYQTMTEVITDLQLLLRARVADSTTRVAGTDLVKHAPGGSSGRSGDSPLKRFLEEQDIQTTPVTFDITGDTVSSTAAEPTDFVSPDRTTMPAVRERRANRFLRTVLSLLLIGAVIAAGVVFRILTRDGVLLIEIPQEVAENISVEVDGEQARITRQDGKMITVAVSPGGHDKLLVTVDGVDLLTAADEGFEIDAGGELTIMARLLRSPEEPRPQWTGRETHLQNYALSFDGQTTVVETPLRLNQPTPFTIEARIRPEAFRTTDPLQILVGASHVGLRRNRSDERIIFLLADEDGGQIVVMDEPLATGEWIHVAGVCDGTEIILYVDGMKQAEVKVAQLGDIVLGKGRITIGGNMRHNELPTPEPDRCFNGLIDEVRISSIARYSDNFTPEDRFEPDENTLALYHFDEGDGDVLIDSSGNEHHGEIHEAKWVRVPSYNIDHEGSARRSDRF